MNITTTHKIEPLGDGTTARLVITTFVDGQQVGLATALSGPKEDVEAYVAGKLSWEDVAQRWRTHGVQHVRGTPLIKVGFWWSEQEKELPHPLDYVDATWPPLDRARVIRYLLRGAPRVRETASYRGFSRCRLCGCPNGSRELSDGIYTWPSGLIHYIEDHNVRPPNEDFIRHAIEQEDQYMRGR